MSATGRVMVCIMLAVLAAAGGWLWLGKQTSIAPTALSDHGIGPLYLDQSFASAERLAFRVAPETAFSGIGCSGLDEIRYDGWLGEHPVGIMAMAQDGRIQEIEATLFEPKRADSLEACRVLRDRFAERFIERFGPYKSTWEVSKPVSRELMAQTGPVVMMARWFRAGGSCYVRAHFGPADGMALRSEMAVLAALD